MNYTVHYSTASLLLAWLEHRYYWDMFMLVLLIVNMLVLPVAIGALLIYK